jgi:hypothetical protein
MTSSAWREEAANAITLEDYPVYVSAKERAAGSVD